MHLLKDAGLASSAVTAEVDALLAPYAQPLLDAYDTGAVRGPSIGYINDLIFAQLDLVIEHDLTAEEEDLAFDMLCTSIGLNQ